MARPPALLDPESIQQGVQYLLRAARRDTYIFNVPIHELDARLERLQQLVRRTPKGELPSAFNTWVKECLWPDGRTKMLGALRQRRAYQADVKKTRATLALSRDTHGLLRLLAKRLGNVRLHALVQALALTALSLPEFETEVAAVVHRDRQDHHSKWRRLSARHLNDRTPQA